jgi:hypothetical protein
MGNLFTFDCLEPPTDLDKKDTRSFEEWSKRRVQKTIDLGKIIYSMWREKLDVPDNKKFYELIIYEGIEKKFCYFDSKDEMENLICKRMGIQFMDYEWLKQAVIGCSNKNKTIIFFLGLGIGNTFSHRYPKYIDKVTITHNSSEDKYNILYEKNTNLNLSDLIEKDFIEECKKMFFTVKKEEVKCV